MRPGPEVLASFGASADPVSLPGGEGTAWRAGEVVLKPAGDPRVARWTADLYYELAIRRAHDFRVPLPLRTVAGDGAAGDGAAGDGAAGDWVAQDPLTGAWVAWQWLPGEAASWAGVSPLWPRLIAASRAFHAALAGARAALAGPGRQPVDDRGPGGVGRAGSRERPGGGARAAGRAAAEPAGGAPAGAPARPADPRRPRPIVVVRTTTMAQRCGSGRARPVKKLSRRTIR